MGPESPGRPHASPWIASECPTSRSWIRTWSRSRNLGNELHTARAVLRSTEKAPSFESAGPHRAGFQTQERPDSVRSASQRMLIGLLVYSWGSGIIVRHVFVHCHPTAPARAGKRSVRGGIDEKFRHARIGPWDASCLEPSGHTFHSGCQCKRRLCTSARAVQRGCRPSLGRIPLRPTDAR